MTVDEGYEAAAAILKGAEDRLSQIRSEEDAKVQIITRILIEALGWRHEDLVCETHHENGFSDYLVSDGDRKAFVVEAKRLGEIVLGTSSKSKGYYKLAGPVLKQAHPGIVQAASYCQPYGIPVSVLTDGINWVIFRPWVPHAYYMEKQAVVFPGHNAILEDFSLFYELLAKDECRRSTYQVVFDRIHENRLVLDQALTSPISSSENGIVQKSSLAFDLEHVFSNFFAGLTGDTDPGMIIDCFVETRESRVADFSLDRITRNVLGNISPQEKDVGEGLKAIVKDAVAGEVGQTVFIVGPSGAGKSTFLHRFFARTLSPDVRERCIVIKVDALDASGDEAVALPWMTERAIKSIEQQIFTDGYPLWNDLQGLFHLEYKQRSNGIDALLYQRDKDSFKEKFAGFIEEQVAKDREGYLRRLLSNIVKNRKKLPIFVVDNTDEFSLEYKTVVFQFFQSLRRSVDHCLLLFPATDRSAWTFSKAEIFNIYSSRSFFLPTPSPREMFRKRIDYLKGKLKDETEIRRSEYFLGRGIKVKINDLAAFAEVIENIFVDQDYAAKQVGELSNYNMRKSLSLSKRVITSSVLKVDDLVRSYLTGQLAAPTPERFMNALMKGDYEFHKAGDEPSIFPIYQVDSTIKQSPLIHIRILVYLHDLFRGTSDDAERYASVGSLLAYFDVMSISEVALQRAISALLSAGLAQPYDLSKKGYSDDQRISITESGLIHLELAIYNPVFFEQMALVTRITNPDTAQQIKDAYTPKATLNQRLENVRGLFCNFLIYEDAKYCRIPEGVEFRAQADIAFELERRWKTSSASVNEMLQLPEIAAEGVRGIVEQFDHTRGFGFVDIPSLKDRAFLHASAIERSDVGDIYDGDDIICNITRSNKGLAVSKILEVTRAESRTFRGVVAKILEERGYGFVHIEETGIDAFFHFHLLSPRQRTDLYEGQELSVEVKTDKQGRSQVRRVAG